jgi:hypothetical protein
MAIIPRRRIPGISEAAMAREMFRHLAGLVRLKGADEMPFDVAVLKQLHLCQRLLDIIFTESSLAQPVKLADAFRLVLLAYGQNGYIIRISACFAASGGNSRTNIIKIFF